MAGHKRPSFLKKQKEQQRKVWATEKRAARAARREAKNTDDIAGPEALDELMRDPGAPAGEEAAAETEVAPEDASRP